MRLSVNFVRVDSNAKSTSVLSFLSAGGSASAKYSCAALLTLTKYETNQSNSTGTGAQSVLVPVLVPVVGVTSNRRKLRNPKRGHGDVTVTAAILVFHTMFMNM